MMRTEPTSWRIVLHALDRTGPPMLALSFLRWISEQRPADRVAVVAFRGGELVDRFVAFGPTIVLLDPGEPWDVHGVVAERAVALQHRAALAGPADVTLLVSVAGAQALRYLPSDGGPVVTWVVEQGADLHWIDDPTGVVAATTRWIAGSAGTADALADRLPAGTPITVCREFVDEPVVSADLVHFRSSLGVEPDGRLVVGAGIGTARKGVDLFVEVALAARRRGSTARFAWLGGEHDALYWRARDESRRVGLDDLRWVGTVGDVAPWIAAADVFLHTARLDAFPLVCLTAALVGTPTVAFAGAGGLEEMFGPAFVGARYPDVTALAALVDEVGEQPAAARFAAGQRDAVATRFVTGAAAPALLDAVLGTAPGPETRS